MHELGCSHVLTCLYKETLCVNNHVQINNDDLVCICMQSVSEFKYLTELIRCAGAIQKW